MNLRRWCIFVFVLLVLIAISLLIFKPKIIFGNSNFDNSSNEKNFVGVGNDSEEICGNEIVEGSEECDGDNLNGNNCSNLGYTFGKLKCSEDCKFDKSLCGSTTSGGSEETSVFDSPVCGNSVNESGEKCDDGNSVSGDGCSSSCLIETGWACRDNSDSLSLCGPESCSIIYSDTGYNSSYLTSYINDVITNVSTNNSISCVYLTRGNFITNNRILLKANLSFEGAGIDETIITNTKGNDSIIYRDTTEEYENMTYEVANLSIQGQGGIDFDTYDSDPDENAIYIYAISTSIQIESIDIKNVLVRNVLGGGIFAKHSRNVNFENNIVENSNFVAFTPVGKDISVINCSSNNTRLFMEALNQRYEIGTTTSIVAKNLTARNLFMYGIRWGGASNGTFDNITLVGNKNFNVDDLYAGAYGFDLRSDDSEQSYNRSPIGNATFSNLHVEHLLYGMVLSQDNETNNNASIESMIISNSNFTDLWISGINFNLQENATNITRFVRITNNTITNFNQGSSFTSGSGIILRDMNNVTISNNTVSSSQTISTKAIPVLVYRSNNISIIDNDFTNPNTVPYIWVTNESTNIYENNNLGINGLYYYGYA